MNSLILQCDVIYIYITINEGLLYAATKMVEEKESTTATANSTKAQHNIQRKDNRYSSLYISL
jgi:hypothetical protein